MGLGFSVLYMQTSQVRADVNTVAANFSVHLKTQQSHAASGKNDADFGIHLNADSYVLFEGSTYNLNDPNNYRVHLPPTIVIQNISLNGAGADIIFRQPLGETTNYGSLEFYSSQIQKIKTVTITNIGKIHHD